ncbi:MAG: serine/threonine-protein kinase [Myxococcota bacterium]
MSVTPPEPHAAPPAPPLDVVAADVGDRTEDGTHERARGLPERIGPYRVEALLGRGGMGEVYRAFDPRLHRHVALKRILPGRHTATAQARFWREARALAALHHPGLVAIHDIGEEQGNLYLAMELVAGTPLSELLGARWTPAGGMALTLQAARALGAAHQAGIVHRDIKPSNILVDPDGRPRVVDFGLARRAGDDDAVTAADAMVGTIHYMAPEQVSGLPPTPATDVHALGSVLYAPDRRAAARARAARGGRGGHHRGVHRRVDELLSRRAARAGRRHRALPGARPGAPAGRRNALATAWRPSPAACIDRSTRPRCGPSWGLLRGGEQPLIDTARLAGRRGSGHGAGRRAGRRAARRPRPRRARATTALGVDAGRAGRRRRGDRRAAAGRGGAALGRGRCTQRRGGVALRGVGRRRARRRRSGRARRPRRRGAARVHRLRRRHGHRARPARAGAARRRGRPRGVGRIEGDGGMVTVEAVVAPPESGAAGVRVSATGPRRDPLALARGLYRAIAAELDWPVPELPTITTSKDAWRALVLARDANLLDHLRALDKQVTAAQRAQPELVATKLYAAQLELGYDHTERGLALLGEVLAQRSEVSPRDASMADLLIMQYDPERRKGLVQAVDAHLRRWPHDLEARILELHLRFIGIAGARLGESIPFAEDLLDAAPSVPIIASKLVRALGWTGRAGEIEERLAAHGVRPDAPNMASVFAEAALYAKDYARAIALFKSDASDDGQVPYYGLHMAIAAEMLGGDPVSAAAHAKARIEGAVGSGKPVWLDWTYYLWFNALMGGGQLDAALLAVDEWAARTGTTHAPTTYRGSRWEVRLLIEPDPRPVLAEIHAALDSERDKASEPAMLLVLARVETDPAVLERWIAKLDERLGKDLEGSSLVQTDIVLRQRQGLQARLAMLQEKPDEALRIYASLATLDHQQPNSEGDLFSIARWTRAWAEALDQAGRPAEAEVVWHRLLDLGYERVLAMETTYAALRRLQLLPR